ncbi:choice-of-anchor D domain-containing protein [Nocardioides dongxiaopingii]|uniref:choice-of-anchor D domain-containing protein n=1 Tax=Nocardioides TaxID=1839 RepID=UPI001484D2CC|nr:MULTISPECIES: choice-of-anchor D domain-containing protein [Nocardioides]
MTDEGTEVRATFTLANRTDVRQAPRRATVFIVATDRPVGSQRRYRVGATRTPALPAGARRTVRAFGTVPPTAVAGSYHVRVCLPPSPGGRCAVSRTAVVQVGPAALAAEPRALTFTGTAPPLQDVRITNVGQSRTNRVTLALGGPDAAAFTTSEGTCGPWLVPGASCTAQVGLAPGGDPTRTRTASLVVAGGGRGATTVPLEATAAPTGLSISPAAWDYGSVTIGQTATRTFRLVNGGDTDLPLTRGDLSDYGNFLFDYVEGENTCLQNVIPAHGFCTFSVAFAPTATGPLATTATFGGGELTATSELTGTGVGPAVRPTARAGRPYAVDRS